MITPPPTAEPPQPGPLAAPSEDELAAAYRELRDQALTLPWAAVALGLEPAHLEALARAGELLVVPGPWPMRQAYASGLGYFLPAWQLAAGGHVPHEALPTLLTAAAERGWTSLDLHRFMTTPLTPDGPSPAELLRQGSVARVVTVARGEPDPDPPAPEPRERLLLGSLSEPSTAAAASARQARRRPRARRRRLEPARHGGARPER